MLMISDKENNMIGKDYYWYQKGNLLGFSKTKIVHLNVLCRNQLCALPSSFEDLQVLCPKGMEKTTNRLPNSSLYSVEGLWQTQVDAVP